VLGQELGLQTTLVLTAAGEFLAVAGLLAPPIRTLRELHGARAGT
jgi:hypothetical protein